MTSATAEAPAPTTAPKPRKARAPKPSAITRPETMDEAADAARARAVAVGIKFQRIEPGVNSLYFLNPITLVVKSVADPAIYSDPDIRERKQGLVDLLTKVELVGVALHEITAKEQAAMDGERDPQRLRQLRAQISERHQKTAR